MLLPSAILTCILITVSANRDEILKCRAQLSAPEIWVLSDNTNYIIMNTMTQKDDNKTMSTHIGNMSSVMLQTQMLQLHQFYSTNDSLWTEVYSVIIFHWQDPIFWIGISIGLMFASMSLSTVFLFAIIYLNRVLISNFARQVIQPWHTYFKSFKKCSFLLPYQPLLPDSILMSSRRY